MSRKFFRVIIPVLIVIEFFSVFLSIKSFVNRDLKEIKEEHAIDKENYGMYIQNDEGKYVEYTDSVFFPEGYDLNLEKSSCVDVKGNAINDILSINETSITMVSNKTAYCYLYFDEKLTAGETIIKSNPDNLSKELVGGLYRYQGTADVVTNNYFCFGTNDKEKCLGNSNVFMYRIIGINEDNQIKLIKTNAVDNTPWHTNYSFNATWSNCSLRNNLNQATFLTKTTYIPSAEWSDLIENTKWYYGDVGSRGYTTDEMFNLETTFSDWVQSKISLMYIHDYFYAGLCSTCMSSCSSWLNFETEEWTMSRKGASSGGYHAWAIMGTYTNISGQNTANCSYASRPVFYLKADITLSGSGTTDDPYIIN